ncbi:MAG: hypothetical protein KC583_10430, partial [Myxococcales bacterium]|nr:hypothetical protein [Myxococcales bacterium]
MTMQRRLRLRLDARFVELLKAIAHGDRATMSMFDTSHAHHLQGVARDPSRGGKLVLKPIVDKRGTSTARWARRPQPPAAPPPRRGLDPLQLDAFAAAGLSKTDPQGVDMEMDPVASGMAVRPRTDETVAAQQEKNAEAEAYGRAQHAKAKLYANLGLPEAWQAWADKYGRRSADAHAVGQHTVWRLMDGHSAGRWYITDPDARNVSGAVTLDAAIREARRREGDPKAEAVAIDPSHGGHLTRRNIVDRLGRHSARWVDASPEAAPAAPAAPAPVPESEGTSATA